MRKARRGQLQNAGHFAVLVACRLRSPIALSEEESQRVVVQVIDALRLRRLQEAIVARPFLCRFSYPSIFRAKIVLQNSFFFQRPFWELPSRASDGSISGTSFARNFFSSDRLSQVLCFLSFFSIFLLVFCSFLCRGEGNFFYGVKVCLSSCIMFFSLPRRGEFLSMV